MTIFECTLICKSNHQLILWKWTSEFIIKLSVLKIEFVAVYNNLKWSGIKWYDTHAYSQSKIQTFSSEPLIIFTNLSDTGMLWTGTVVVNFELRFLILTPLIIILLMLIPRLPRATSIPVSPPNYTSFDTTRAPTPGHWKERVAPGGRESKMHVLREYQVGMGMQIFRVLCWVVPHPYHETVTRVLFQGGDVEEEATMSRFGSFTGRAVRGLELEFYSWFHPRSKKCPDRIRGSSDTLVRFITDRLLVLFNWF